MSHDETFETQDVRVETDSPKPRALDRVAVYSLAVAAGTHAWDDAVRMKAEPLLAEIAPQLVRAVGSVAANIAEGYARRSPRDRIRFYEYALGSAEEAASWYHTAHYVLTAGDADERATRLTSIRRLLLVMIRNERTRGNWNSPKR